MVNTKFESYKLQREITRSGKEYQFNKFGVNEVGEPTDEPELVGTVKGIYHEQNGHISVTTGDTTQTRTKKVPCILCLYEDVKELAIGHYTIVNDKKFTVTGIVDVQEWNIIADVSLEVTDVGGI